MNWLKENSQWILPLITNIIGIVIGKTWDQLARNKHVRNELKSNILAENSKLKQEIEQIKSIQTLRAKYNYNSKGYYYPKNEPQDRKICSRCLDSEGKEISLIISVDDYFRCPLCNNSGCLRDNPYDMYDGSLDEQISAFNKFGN